jgi:hypothetical protein
VYPRQSRRAERERLTGRQLSVSLPGLRSGPTWENGVEHSGSPLFADTEEVTGSNPVAPTTVLLSRAFADSAVPLGPGGGAGTTGRRALPCLTNLFTSAGCRTYEWPSGSPTTGADIPEAAPPSRRDQ